MPDASTPAGSTPPPAGGVASAGSTLQIPQEVAAKFADLIELIKASESMNLEERQYWVNILPIMTPEQVKNLRDILTNERDQLKAIDEKYAKEMEKIGQTEAVRKTEEDRRAKRSTRASAETQRKQEEDQKAEDILRTIESGSV